VGEVLSKEDKMAKTSNTLERVKEGVGEVVEKAREALNDRLESAKDKFDDGADLLDRRVRKAMAQARGSVGRVVDDVTERFEEAEKTLTDGYKRTKKRLRRLNRSARAYVADNPVRSLLIASGVGLLVGLAASPRRWKA